MNFKKKSLILSIFIIVIIQISLLINNKQKTYLELFTWKSQDVSIGKLISFSFISGLLISTILNKTITSNFKHYLINEDDDKTIPTTDFKINTEDNNENYEMPPERDLRDTQPTISVNYRVIKDNFENEFIEKNQRLKDNKGEDDWNSNESEW